MFWRKIWTIAAVCCGLALAMSANIRADDWIQTSVKVAGGGTLDFEFPQSWGKKPEVATVEGMTTVRFGPYGPRKKPFFLVHVESITAVEQVSAEDLLNITTTAVANHKTIAVETDVPINDLNGPSVAGHYFSITDRESKIGEFDYLTLAILRSDFLLVKCYFFSSDGAPDFGADAMQMMASIQYVPPELKPEKK